VLSLSLSARCELAFGARSSHPAMSTSPAAASNNRLTRTTEPPIIRLARLEDIERGGAHPDEARKLPSAVVWD
jgi:hypothetical protein